MTNDRGIYRTDLFNGVVEYQIFDSNGLLICKSELIRGYATDMLEERMAEWLDMVDPIDPKESVSVSAASLVASALLSASVLMQQGAA